MDIGKILVFGLFFVIFLSLYISLHWYVLNKVSGFFSFKKTMLVYVVTAILAASFFVATFLMRYSRNWFSRSFYWFGSVWLGGFFILLCLVLISEVFKFFVKAEPTTMGLIILSATILVVVYGIINGSFLKVQEIEIGVPNIRNETRIVQISDVHLGAVNGKEYLSKIVEKTNSLRPDLVFITGDLFDGGVALEKDIVESLENLKAPVYFVIGNHEQYEGLDKVLKLLKESDVKILRNESVIDKGVQIIGIDNTGDKRINFSEILEGLAIDKGKPKILLSHAPSGLEEAHSAGVDLQLSGHTHGGQIFPFNGIVWLFFKKIRGTYEYNGTKLYVSSGAGTWGPPMRIGSSNEIVLIKLIPN